LSKVWVFLGKLNNLNLACVFNGGSHVAAAEGPLSCSLFYDTD